MEKCAEARFGEKRTNRREPRGAKHPHLIIYIYIMSHIYFIGACGNFDKNPPPPKEGGDMGDRASRLFFIFFFSCIRKNEGFFSYTYTRLEKKPKKYLVIKNSPPPLRSRGG